MSEVPGFPIIPFTSEVLAAGWTAVFLRIVIQKDRHFFLLFGRGKALEGFVILVVWQSYL
jgi:hypothetical protein